MPIKKTITTARPRKTNDQSAVSSSSNQDENTLMEFEQFVANQPTRSHRSGKNKSWLALTLILVIVVLGALWLFMSQMNSVGKDNKFKVVYLENGETYYAKIIKEDALNIYLDEVYYIQFVQQTVEPEEAGGEAQVIDVPILVKRGQELHRPQGLMQINRDKLVAVEEIGSGSEILKEINRINEQEAQQAQVQQ